MAIRRMISEAQFKADPTHAELSERWTNDYSNPNKTPIYIRTTHVGLVLSLREANGYDDSDFYATVWNDTLGKTEEIMYATTRGWTYPNNAEIDASPEVIAKYEAWREKCRLAEQARHDAEIAKMPKVGQKIRVIGGRKVAKGTVAEIFWFGKDKYKEARSSRYANPYAYLLGFHYHADEYRAGIRLIDGTKVFIAANQLEIVKE